MANETGRLRLPNQENECDRPISGWIQLVVYIPRISERYCRLQLKIRWANVTRDIRISCHYIVKCPATNLGRKFSFL
jgi:hypothetical protein